MDSWVQVVPFQVQVAGEAVAATAEEDHIPGGRVVGHRGPDEEGTGEGWDSWVQVVPFQVQVPLG